MERGRLWGKWRSDCHAGATTRIAIYAAPAHDRRDAARFVRVAGGVSAISHYHAMGAEQRSHAADHARSILRHLADSGTASGQPHLRRRTALWRWHALLDRSG